MPNQRTVRVLGASLAGAGAELVTVEARFDAREQPRMEILLTGLPDSVLRESRGRLECALVANGLDPADGRLYLNLVPAARRKSGESLDLALALGAGAALGHFDARVLRKTLFLGELGIDGRMHAVPGGLAAGLAARNAGVARLIAPPATAAEAAAIEGLEVYGARHLAQVLAHLCGRAPPLVRLTPPALDEQASLASGPSLDDVRGLGSAKQALALAAAGGHGVLFIGPPGSGKSMLARRFMRLLPPPTQAERMEITRVLSAAGRWPGGLARERPYRAPHHTVSHAGLVGGGAQIHPGEITLAHCGVLFLDELPEFRRDALEALREPLESGRILISRAGRQVELPARFQLIAAMNPCPCGYRGHPRVPCRCTPQSVQRYRSRISGPLADRMDLVLEILPASLDELAHALGASGTSEATSSRSATWVSSTAALNTSASASVSTPTPPELSEAALQERVARARARMAERQGGRPNATLDARELDRWAPLEREARLLFERALRRRAISARAVQSLRRVARSAADMEGVEMLGASHIAQALALRAELV